MIQPTSHLHLIHRVDQITDEQFWRVAKNRDLDVTHRQALLLRAAQANPRASQTALCDITCIDRSTMAEMIKRLVDRGLLSRRKSKEDSRAYVILTTEKGDHVAEVAGKIIDDIETQMLADIPQSHLRILSRALGTMALSVEQKPAAA